MSPSGLASWRSRSVKALIMSLASKARFRFPTLICVSTPAERSRPMASLACGKLRPISSAAPRADRIGAPGSARRSRSVADPALICPSWTRHWLSICSTRCSKEAASSAARTQDPANVPIHRLSPTRAASPVAGPRYRVAVSPSM